MTRPRERSLGEKAAEQRIAACRESKGVKLELPDLGLEYMPEAIRDLTWLEHLDLRYNDIEELPGWIGELALLRSLVLFGNEIFEIPSSVADLVDLEMLVVSGMRRQPPVLSRLTQLKHLWLSDCGLREMPPWVRSLTRLEQLWLDFNDLERLPEWIGELKRLEDLQLAENPIRKLPSSLRTLPLLKELSLGRNSSLNVPAEILDTRNARRILDYYFRVHDHVAVAPLNEFKLVLVGRGGVGKTSLVQRLVFDRYKEFKRTPGIKITEWPMRIESDDVKAHVWDFGGQEIMHGTHRFFMTERALYLVLVSGREGTEDRDAEYWLSLVRSFAGNVPVLVLLHRSGDYAFELNRQILRAKYGDVGFLQTDSKTGLGIEQLRTEIQKQAARLEGLKAPWPAEWRQVKDELPQARADWLTYDAFREFCRERGIAEPGDQDLLASSLHALGLMLSYEDEGLREFGVLNPQWVTKGIYEILNSPVLREDGGKFTLASFGEILPKKKYPERLHPYLLALMRKFELCHPLDDKATRFLIPELLTKEEPAGIEADFSAEGCLNFTYSYDAVLPEGLLPRFIVGTYVLREPRLAWRTGVVLERGNCRALVRGDIQGRRIEIRVAGKGGHRELLGIIREHFERIHLGFERLPITELVPIPGHPATEVKYSILLKCEREGRASIAVEVEDRIEDVDVKTLLEGVDAPGVPRSGKALVELVHGTPLMFISYSRKDEVLLDQFRTALVPYERAKELKVWADPLIEPGQPWREEIFQNIDRAAVFAILLSNDCLASEWVDKELQRATERGCEILPIVVRECRYDKLPIGKIQAIRPFGKPIDEHEKSDRAWHEVTLHLDKVLERVKRRKT